MRLKVKDLIARKSEILTSKRFSAKKSDFIEVLKTFSTSISKGVSKSENVDTDDELTRTIVGNTYYWLDSHGDVHVKDCFLDSIKNRGLKRISHLHDHRNEVVAKVGVFKDVYERSVTWKDLGVDMNGETTALFADTLIKRSYNKVVFELYKDGEINQHSVGMRYIDVDVAINDEDDKEGYKLWNEIYPMLGNKDQADKYGYFFVVQKAELIEISAVLNGSNSVTPTIDEDAESQEKKETVKTETEKEVKEVVKSNYYYTNH